MPIMCYDNGDVILFRFIDNIFSDFLDKFIYAAKDIYSMCNYHSI